MEITPKPLEYIHMMLISTIGVPMQGPNPPKGKKQQDCPLRHLVLSVWICAILLFQYSGLFHAAHAAAQEPGTAIAFESAPVYVDGERLFDVRGTTAFPAQQRARTIRERVIEAANDPSFDPSTIEFRHGEQGIALWGAGRSLVTILSADARAEDLEPQILADAVKMSLIGAIQRYRQAREPAGIRHAVQTIIVATVVFALLICVIVLLARSFSRLISRHFKGRIDELERKTQNILKFHQFWKFLQYVVRLIFILVGLFALYYYINTVLLALPWTRGFATRTFDFVSDPLLNLASALVDSIPDLITLAIIVLVARFVLKLVQTFFARVHQGKFRLANFEPEWAQPTDRLIRIGVVAIAIIMAYPYVPGSGSDAFKGISIFAGVVLSLGSSSIISNIIAGYSMIYRRAFQIGDRVAISDVEGYVEEMRLFATHIRTPKNEMVTLPNSVVLNSQIVNYTRLTNERGLILHTEVGIGYEVPWRQVEAMLLEAARRTPNLLKTPPPFVLQRQLGDFSPIYELNAYTRDADSMLGSYSALHANIQDVFAEQRVQIMTPSYEGDPEQEKIPPLDSVASTTRPT